MTKLTYIVVLSISQFAFSQQTPLSGMFWNNYAHYNPATSGLAWGHELNLTYRDQWSGVTGRPVSFLANYNTIVSSKHGVGLNYVYDRIGFSKIHDGHFNYNYQFTFENASKLAIGAAAGINNYSYEANWFPPTTTQDVFLPSSANETSLSINTGVAYLSKRIFTGVGLTRMSPKRSNQIYFLSPHLHAHFRYRFLLTRNSSLYLGGIAHTDFSFHSFDIAARYSYKQKLWFGLSYRNHDMIGANVTWDFKKKFTKFRVGYMYEYTINKLSSVSNGSHEIILGMRIF